MEIQPLDISGILLIQPRKFGDARGYFSETYNKAALAEAGFNREFVQDNHTLSTQRGVVRGLHFQAPPYAQDKLIRVLRGRIFDIAVDLRRSSPSYGRHIAIELSADNWQQLLIPAGFAHGFATLEANTEVAYKVTNFYAPAHDFGMRWNDPALGIDWPVTPAEAITSDKDRALPLFGDMQSPFA